MTNRNRFSLGNDEYSGTYSYANEGICNEGICNDDIEKHLPSKYVNRKEETYPWKNLAKDFKLKFQRLRRSSNIWFVLCISTMLGFFLLGSFHNISLSYYIGNKKEKLSETFISSPIDAPFQIGCREPDIDHPRANAAFVVLARNSELDGVVRSMISLERHFNQWFNYPWVFLNNELFTDEFKDIVQKYTTSKVEFGLIPPEQWQFRSDVDKNEIRESIESQGDRTILYGNMESYHKMCRFYSGAFYKHDLVKKRDWYWRVEPDVEFFCDLTYDPFVEMERHDKKYGFNVMITELYYTVPGLFRETQAFIKKNGVNVKGAWDLFVSNSKYVIGENKNLYDGLSNKREVLDEIERNINLKEFLQQKGKKDNDVAELNTDILHQLFKKSKRPTLYEDRIDGEEYNLCHFWSNFEIARTDLFNSPEYQAYFEHLDESGGFYRERWGDASIHSLAVGMMLDLKDVHYFRDIGYKHSVLGHCPANSIDNQLKYSPAKQFSYKGPTESMRSHPQKGTKNGVGCRCVCPYRHKEIENSGFCLQRWKSHTREGFKTFQPLDLNRWERRIEKRIKRHLAEGGKIGSKKVVDDLI